jgi:hypothetical protein
MKSELGVETGRFSPRRFLEWQISRLLRTVGLCACPKEMTYSDLVTGDQIRLTRPERFLVLSVNTRDYIFDPLTGALVGTGMGCSGSTPLFCYRPDRKPRLVPSRGSSNIVGLHGNSE